MASSYYKLDIADRKELRKRGAKVLREKGFVPGVLYYSGEENVNISIEKSVLFRAMQSGQRIFEVEQGGENQYTMIKQLQYHPVTDDIIHVDLMRVRRSEKMSISVPLLLIGESIGVKEGGLLSQSLNQVEISCYPTDVPENIKLDISKLELNDALSVADIKIDIEDLEVISDPILNIVSVTPPASEEEATSELEDDDQVEADGDERVSKELDQEDPPSTESSEKAGN